LKQKILLAIIVSHKKKNMCGISFAIVTEPAASAAAVICHNVSDRTRPLLVRPISFLTKPV
jgi:hypothetical protein